MTKYIIYSKNLSNGFQEEISKEQFEEFVKSKEVLFEVRQIENIYNILIITIMNLKKNYTKYL